MSIGPVILLCSTANKGCGFTGGPQDFVETDDGYTCPRCEKEEPVFWISPNSRISGDDQELKSFLENI